MIQSGNNGGGMFKKVCVHNWRIKGGGDQWYEWRCLHIYMGCCRLVSLLLAERDDEMD